MKDIKSNRTRRVTLRFTPEEFQQIEKHFHTATSRKLSDFLRKVIMGEKVVNYTRNQSIDDFLTDMVLLRNQLSAIGNNFNQAVKKLNAVRQVPDILPCYLEARQQYKPISAKIDEIKSSINKLSDLWLHG
ncbi:hypothetical protein [Chitinophaga sp. GbtcB8]|uniref:plasmid mobilization protein n=1 Tax=Chitinophaga sp. GbtcB8 TaxID=2824753 RepID=UPI001C30746D|nr:hypothetical protein [Chitinophaga sp. GbtcB8]